MNIESTPYEKTPYLEPEKIWGEDSSQLLANTCNNNTLQKDKQAITMNLLITPPISSQERLSPSPSEYSKNKITAQCRQNEKISKELAKSDKQTYDSGFSKSMRNLFCFAAKLIYATSLVIKKQHT